MPLRIRPRALRLGARLAVLALVAVTLSAPGSATSRPTRFHADVAGPGSGPGHRFFVGDGLYLEFRDTYRSETHYRVCYSRGTGRRCWHRTTGRRGRASRVFISAPDSVGTYTATWSVSGRPVARWSWFNGPGD